jgi:nucleoside-diphosphate-sugar epimerase
MRIAIIGGTNFIGPAILEELLRSGREAAIIHRGLTEAADLPPTRHIHCDRRDADALGRALGALAPEEVVDTCAASRADAEALAKALPPRTRLVVLSSMDVYGAFSAINNGVESDSVPLDEASSLRTERFVRRGQTPTGDGVDPETYEKLDVEDAVLAMGATVLRVPMVYGPRDHRRREEFILRRVRAGRRRIPFGAGNLLWTKVWVRDLAAVVRLAAESPDIGSMVMNVGERRAFTIEQWVRRILAASGATAELVRVSDERLPPDLFLTAAHKQHQLLDCSRARETLKWRETDPEQAIRESVRWHLANPPSGTSDDFEDDDKALETSCLIN